MATRIRLSRFGAKKKPFYRLVVAESSSPRDGKFIEIVGTYDPRKDPVEIKLEGEKISEWLKKGAQPTLAVKAILKKGGIDKGLLAGRGV